MEQQVKTWRKAVSVATAVVLALSLSLMPGLARAATGSQALSTAQPAAPDMPEWALDPDAPQADASRALTTQSALPPKYDLRSAGFVTPVKFQNPWSSCWAFGGIAAAETSILSSADATYAETGLDLSERHLAYYALSPITASVDPDQAGEGINLLSDEPNAPLLAGGNPLYITTLFSQGIGPVTEEAFPYRGKDGMTMCRDRAISDLEQVAAAEGMTREEFVADQIAKGVYASEEALIESWTDDYRQGLGVDWYSTNDDWSIPELNASGEPNRMLTGGYVLKDGNILPTYWKRDAEGDATNDEGKTAIKQELMNGRGVSIMFYADQSGRYDATSADKGVHYAQYAFEEVPADHAVCIVGWDDTYSKDNFAHAIASGTDDQGQPIVDEQLTAQTTPPGDGAWIVKNSWGSTSADADVKDDLGNAMNRFTNGQLNEDGTFSGYSYLSYYDKTIGNAESLAFSTNLGSSDGFYALQYDYMPADAGFYQTVEDPDIDSSKPVSTASVFTAEEPMELRSVSTRTSSENMRVTFAVYLLDGDAAKPSDGTLVQRTSVNFEHAGFHRLDLDQRIPLKAGQRFSIVSTASAIDDGGNRVYSAAASKGISEKLAKQSNLPRFTQAVVNPGESFLFSNGQWQDWKDYIGSLGIPAELKNDPEAAKEIEGFKTYAELYPLDNFSIKAYAVPMAEETSPGEAAGQEQGSSPTQKETSEGSTQKESDSAGSASDKASEGLDVGESAVAGSDDSLATYTVTSATTVRYDQVYAKDAKVARVPATVIINGALYKVTDIADKAFAKSKATRIFVGDNVKSIGKGAFSGASAVKELTLGANVSKIAAKAFTGAKALRIITLKTTKLAAASKVKNCLAQSKVTAVKVKVGTTKQNKKFVKKYKKLFAVKKPAAGKKVAVS